MAWLVDSVKGIGKGKKKAQEESKDIDYEGKKTQEINEHKGKFYFKLLSA